MAYAAVFAVLGMILLTAIGAFGLSPMALPFAGGFMLVGPIMLTGYFELARLQALGKGRTSAMHSGHSLAPAALDARRVVRLPVPDLDHRCRCPVQLHHRWCAPFL